MTQAMTESFGSRSVSTSTETHTSALAAAAKAAVEAKYTMALLNRRSVDDARVRILRSCARPRFAATAKWRKPQGRSFIEGPSIRLAEELARQYGNVDLSTTTLVDDPQKRILSVEGKDLESNVGFSQTITIAKVVERRDPKDRLVIGERSNTNGDRVYLVEATEDELLNKINAQVSKAVRTIILRLIPGDLVEEALDACAATLEEGAKKDPSATKRKLVDSFAAIGVMPRDLESYLGHGLDAISPKEIDDLRGMYAAISTGEASWSDLVASRGAESEMQAADGAPKKAATTALADQIKNRKAAKARADAPTATESKLADDEAVKTDEATAPTEPAPEAAPAKELTDEEKAALIDRGDDPNAY